MNAFDEKECDLLEQALSQAHLRFIEAGQLSGRNEKVAVPALSRAIIHAAGEGLRDPDKLAGYAVAWFHLFTEEVRERDLSAAV